MCLNRKLAQPSGMLFIIYIFMFFILYSYNPGYLNYYNADFEVEWINIFHVLAKVILALTSAAKLDHLGECSTLSVCFSVSGPWSSGATGFVFHTMVARFECEVLPFSGFSRSCRSFGSTCRYCIVLTT